MAAALPRPSDPLGLAAALAADPEAGALAPEEFAALHRRIWRRLATDLAGALAGSMDAAQLAEYAAAAHYQDVHPGTGDHTRAWIGANLPPDAAATAARLIRQAVMDAAQSIRTHPSPGPGGRGGNA
ncbi:hypothetical protein [Sinomonas humi]|uniref:Uncharacterized protein n=1 Tax=Sinomonas humi TaxID=1338436 RepID=A0A0B2AF36_9MICC|nr:hypothetical protein [Sinomonas humi]KHL00272.1 hypothetical protein LK10_20605 [Sinomonas humi]